MQFMQVTPSPSPSLSAGDKLGNLLDQTFGWIPGGLFALFLVVTACFFLFFLGRRLFGHYGEAPTWFLVAGSVGTVGGAIWSTIDATNRMPEAWRGATAPGLVLMGIVALGIYAWAKAR